MASADVTCAHCGVQFPQIKSRGRPRRFCTRECMARFHAGVKRERKGIEPRWADGIPTCHKDFTCYWCEETFKPKRAGFTKCCSRECGFEWLRYKRAAARRAVFTVAPPKPPRVIVDRTRRCPDCSAPIGMAGVHRCEECREKRAAVVREKARQQNVLSGQRAARRKARKLRLRGVTVENVNPIKVLDRDRWTCQLCGIKTPKRLRGTYEDTAPEVDHIIPIAEGGEHSYRNTQASCRRCNIEKSNKPLGQLRMFG